MRYSVPDESSGQRAEFEATTLRYLDELFSTAVRLTGSRAEAEDLVQEAVMRAWAHWYQFVPGTNARAWLHRIVTNTFINGYRRRRREREVLSDVRLAAESTDDRTRPWRLEDRRCNAAAPAAGVGDEVDAALQSLPEAYRSVVLMVDMNELSYKEVARVLGCPVGTVMSRLHRARRVLKRRLRTYAQASGYVQQAA